MSETSSVAAKASVPVAQSGDKNTGLSTSVVTGKYDHDGLVKDDFFDDVCKAHKMFPNCRNPMQALDWYYARMHPEKMEISPTPESEDEDMPVEPKRGVKRAAVAPLPPDEDEEEVDDCPLWLKDQDEWNNEDYFNAAEELPFEYDYAQLSLPAGKERSHHCQ